MANCSSSDAESEAATSTGPRSTTTVEVTTTSTAAATTGTASTTPAPPVATGADPGAAVDAARLYASWRPGCPVGPESLRLLALPFWGFDGESHTGEMVVHRDVAAQVESVFRALYDARFPIERMELVDVYDGSDDASMMANNTSGFNCREITGGGRWSQHSYGRAIDVNPVQNPYVYRDGSVLDPAAARFTDRSLQEPGMIRAGDVVVHAFAGIGWGWGGNFTSTKDYQHFSESGG